MYLPVIEIIEEVVEEENNPEALDVWIVFLRDVQNKAKQSPVKFFNLETPLQAYEL
jgi:hypothetical protein